MMKKIMRKKIIISIISILSFMIISINSYASVIGSFNFVAIDNKNGEAIQDLDVVIIQVATKDPETGKYVTTNGFEGTSFDLLDLSESNLEDMKNYAAMNSEVTYRELTNTEGKFNIESVEEGSYLFVQASSHEVYTMQTMLITIPEADGNGEENYNITVKPKIIKIVDDEEKEEEEEKLDDKVPQTGVLNWPVPVLAVSGVVLFSIGWIVFYTKSKKKIY